MRESMGHPLAGKFEEREIRSTAENLPNAFANGGKVR
jgi:hypothetical protein